MLSNQGLNGASFPLLYLLHILKHISDRTCFLQTLFYSRMTLVLLLCPSDLSLATAVDLERWKLKYRQDSFKNQRGLLNISHLLLNLPWTSLWQIVGWSFEGGDSPLWALEVHVADVTGLSDPWLTREEQMLLWGDSPDCCANTSEKHTLKILISLLWLQR